MRTWAITGLIVMMVCGFTCIGYAAETRGTAVEAEKLVNRAMEMLKTQGKAAAYDEINRAGSSFVDRDLYLFVIDTEGNTLAHGFNKKLIGKNMLELRDPDGKFFIKEFITVAAGRGKGWVDYKFTDPITRKIEKKSTYVAGYENLVVGCGIYK